MPEGLSWATPRPIDETYWVVPGRLLVGEHPGSRSRAQALDRVRRFVAAGITCFIDLTEPDETPQYEPLLPVKSPSGVAVKYVREPITDHGVPAGVEQMARIVGSIDDALADGHNIYLHCRAGIGRSALAVGCWLAEKRGSTAAAEAELAELWQQAAQSSFWARIPETDAQVEYLRRWLGPGAQPTLAAAAGKNQTESGTVERLRGAWYGLALGDSFGAAQARRDSTATGATWTQPTAMALCVAHSLLELQRFDARDQIERYVRWQREGYCAADATPGERHATPDVTKALATYQWRGLPMAGSHDPRDATATSLPRVLASVSFAATDPALALSLAREGARTTQQSPIVLDACRFYAAMLWCGLHGQPAESWLTGVCEPVPGTWQAKPLRKDVVAMAKNSGAAASATAPAPDILQVLADARRAVLNCNDFESAMGAACRAGTQAPLQAAVIGTLFGLRHGIDGLPAERRLALVGRELLDTAVQRLIARGLHYET
jgi:ADP-ribosylglycohydrolase